MKARKPYRSSSIESVVVARCEQLTVADVAWIELEEFALAVIERDTIPTDTLRRLANAIQSARRNPDALLRGLSLKRPRGRPTNNTATLLWGRRVAHLEDDGHDPEEALNIAQQESDHQYTRTTLQEWRDSYRRQQEAGLAQLHADLSRSDK